MTSSRVPTRRVAVLLAGGAGTRAGLDRPKQLAVLAGRTVLEHSLQALHGHPDVDEVVVVMAADHVRAARDLTTGSPKVSAVLPGGATRTESTLVALAHLGDDDFDLLIHDAARPLVTGRIITECLEALGTYAAVATVVPVNDTIFEVAGDTIRAGPPRSSLRRAQTPQGFHAAVLRRAYAVAAADPVFEATDDCSVVQRYLPDEPVGAVPGDETNIKVTTASDLQVAEALLHLRGR